MSDEPQQPPYRGGCVKGMSFPRDGAPSCHRGCLHRAMVEEYRDARRAWEQRLEAESFLYDAEIEDFREQHPPPTFKAWLEGHAGHRDREEDVA